MKALYYLAFCGLFLTGCATTTTSIQSAPQPSHPPTTAKATHAIIIEKDPISVAFYPHGQTPQTHYKIIGKEVVSKYKGGVKRQEANILDNMRTVAAAMGGDAVIEVARDDKSITGTVIAYDNNESDEKSPV